MAIETIPATSTGSTPYFNPATQRFHDPVTKRMVKTPGGPKSIMDPKSLEPVVTPMSPLDSMMEVFFEMRDNLKELVGLTKESVNIEKKEEGRELRDRRDENITGGDTDPVETGQKGGGDFLGGLKDMFSNIRDKFQFGDKLKLLLLATGLWALGKYSDTIVKTLAPILKWFKFTFIPRMKKVGKWFTKEVENDEGGTDTELDWTKIIGVGLGAWLTTKLVGMTFSIAALKLGSWASRILFGGGVPGATPGRVGFRLLPVAAALAAFSIVGDAISGINWGDEVTDGKPVANWKKGIAAAFAGANNKEGSYGAAIKQGLAWGALGAYGGSYFGPWGTLIGGTIGLIAGGIAGAMGSDKLIKILDGEAEKMVETAVTNALSENSKKVAKNKSNLALLKEQQMIWWNTMKTEGLEKANASQMSDQEWIDKTGHTKEYVANLPKMSKETEDWTGSGILETADFDYDPEIYKNLLIRKQNVSGNEIPLNDAEKQYMFLQDSFGGVGELQGSINQIMKERAEKKLAGWSVKEVEEYRLQELNDLTGYLNDRLDEMQILQEDNFGRDLPQIIEIQKETNKKLEEIKEVLSIKDINERILAENPNALNVQTYKGADTYLQAEHNNMGFFKKTVHDDVTIQALTSSR